MTTMNFSIKINAPKEKVWDKLWSDESYRQWTEVFSPGSYAQTDWQEGSKVLFLTPKGEGMFSLIEKKVPFQEMTFKHLGEVKNGVEEEKDWGNARESYYLKESDGATEVTVQLDSTEDHQKYFSETFPKALDRLKQISEQ